MDNNGTFFSTLIVLVVLVAVIPAIIVAGAILAVIMIVGYIVIWFVDRAEERKAEDSNPTDLRPPTG